MTAARAALVLAMLLAFAAPMAAWGAMILTEPEYPPRRDDGGGRPDPTRPVTR